MRALGGLCLLLALPSLTLGQDPAWDAKHEQQLTDLAERWWRARPATKFEAWDEQQRASLEAEVRALGALPAGKLERLVELWWAPLPTYGPGVPKPDPSKRRAKVKRPKWLPKVAKRGKARPMSRAKKGELVTPYGDAWFYVRDTKAKQPGLILGLHGGGEGSGNAAEPRDSWKAQGCVGFYPQGIRLVHDTWNTVHGERFLLTLIEIAKVHYDVDPDRIYSMGFSMGGSGSWFMAGRHADLLAGAAPCAGVLMAEPKSQVAEKSEVARVQHGLVPNVRNLAMYYYIGLADRNCMPGTYLFVADMLEQLRQADPTGYDQIEFTTYPGLAHAHPPGEPAKAIDWLTAKERDPFPATVVWENASEPFPPRESDDPVPRLPKTMFYWLGCEELEDYQHVRATLDRAANAITVVVQRRPAGTKGITLFLNEQMIDASKPVVVRDATGNVLFEGTPQPDYWTVVETLDARLDRGLVFDRRITL